MAFKSKLMLVVIVAILVLGLVIKEDPSASERYQNRKVLAKGMKQLPESATGGTRGSMNSETNGSERVLLEAVRELRVVPSGPNPLHHHGGGPVKPQTP